MREDEPAPQNESEEMNLLLRTIMESLEKPDLKGRAFVNTMVKPSLRGRAFVTLHSYSTCSYLHRCYVQSLSSNAPTIWLTWPNVGPTSADMGQLGYSRSSSTCSIANRSTSSSFSSRSMDPSIQIFYYEPCFLFSNAEYAGNLKELWADLVPSFNSQCFDQ